MNVQESFHQGMKILYKVWNKCALTLSRQMTLTDIDTFLGQRPQ